MGNCFKMKRYFFFNCQLSIVNSFLLIACCLFIFASCNSTYTSKQKGYFKVDFPERRYLKFEKEGFPYSFEYPAYASVVKDSTYFDNSPDDPYWINIDFPLFQGKIFISYKTIGGKSVYKKRTGKTYSDSFAINSFEKLVNDAYKLTYKNEVKAYSIEDSVMHTPKKVTGVFFKVGGSVATSKQFFLSDTTKNFLRGALYFNTTPNEDSLAPVNAFLQQDLNHLINTLQWKK